MRKKSGVIVIVALMMVSVIVMLTEQLMRSVLVGSRFMKTMVEREKAKTLALSGINIAMAQLLPSEDKPEEDKDDKKNQTGGQQDNKLAKTKKLLKVLLPNLNRWQNFTLDEKKDGIDGSVKICMVSEHGKINLNEAFDFEKQEFKPAYATLIGGLAIQNKLAAGEMLKILQDYFTKRRKKLDDLSELLEIKQFAGIDFIYKPPTGPQNKKEKDKSNEKLTVQDIFTVWTSSAEINLLLLSDALCVMLNIRQPRAQDAVALKEPFKTFIAGYKDEWVQDWEQNWKNITPIYGGKVPPFKNLPSMFAKQFEPVIYSVLSCGKVGQTEQQLLAIIKKVKEKKVVQPTNNQIGQISNNEDQESFKILRLYWL